MAFEHPRLQCLVRGIKYFHASHKAIPLRERLPITRDILLRLLESLDQRSHSEATLYTAFCLAFAALLRIGEFTREHHQWPLGTSLAGMPHAGLHITFDFEDPNGDHPDRLFFTLPASKTDPFRQGITVTVAAANDCACAVSALHLLFTRWPSPPDTQLFMLGQNSKTPESAFNRRTAVDALRGCLTSAGIPGSYSGHSFRYGAATSARAAGVADHDI